MTERERTVPLHCWLCMKQLVARKAGSVRARVCVCMHACAQLCLTLCDAMDCSDQTPLSVEFFRQEYWSKLPFPAPGDLPNPGTEPGSPALPADFLTSEPQGKPLIL